MEQISIPLEIQRPPELGPTDTDTTTAGAGNTVFVPQNARDARKSQKLENFAFPTGVGRVADGNIFVLVFGDINALFMVAR